MAIKGITSCLWFDSQAEDAAKLYCSVFKNSKMGKVTRYGKEGFEIHGQPEGKVMTVDFELEGYEVRRAQRRPALQVQRGDFVPDPLRDAGRDRLLLEEAHRRRRQGKSVRLAEGQVRPVVAGGADRADRDLVDGDAAKVAARHQGVPADEEIRHRGAAERLRSGRPMSLTLYYHPLSSFCHKALIALYENAHAVHAAMLSIWAIRPPPPSSRRSGRSASFRCCATKRGIGSSRNPASSSSISTSTIRAPRGSCPPTRNWRGRRASATGSTICTSICRCRRSSPTGCARPARTIRTASTRPARRSTPRSASSTARWRTTPGRWAIRSRWPTAPPAPPLFYANVMSPLAGPYPNADRYLKRLMERPSYARTIEEARPYLHLFPKA